MKKLVLSLLLLAAFGSHAMVVVVINKTAAPVTLTTQYGELMTVEPGTTNEVSAELGTVPVTFTQPFDDSVGFAPTTVAWLNWISDYSITITKARWWSDPAKLLKVAVRPIRVEYVTVVNQTTESIKVVDVNNHRLYGIVDGAADVDNPGTQTFRFVNRVNLMFRQPYNPFLHRIPTGHTRIPAGGNWNVVVTQPAGYRFNGDVLLTTLTPQ